MKTSSKFLSLVLTLAMLFSLSVTTVSAADTTTEPVQGDIVVLYTNDVHCGIEDAIGYAGLAAYEKAFEKLGYTVALVDNGDAIQGGPIGTLSKGEYIVDIMN